MLKAFFRIIYRYCAEGIQWRRALARKQRSLRDLSRLDDHLLDDVGLYRDRDGSIQSLFKASKVQAGEQGSVNARNASTAKVIAIDSIRAFAKIDNLSLRYRLIYYLRRRL